MFPFRNVEGYAREHEEASRNIQQYLSNPINAYLLVKRLTTDWKKVEELITEDVGKSFVANITNSRSDLKFPTDEDLNGAAVALMRLQDTYKLETAQVARGVLNGVQYSTGLTGTYIPSRVNSTIQFMLRVLRILTCQTILSIKSKYQAVPEEVIQHSTEKYTWFLFLSEI